MPTEPAARAMDVRDRRGFALATVCVSLLAACDGGAGRTPQPRANVAALPPLIQELSLKDPAARTRAIVAIGHMGPAAKEAVPPLIDALKDRDLGVRAAAAYALGQIGPDAEGALPALEALAKQQPTKEVASAAIGKIKP